MQSVFAALVFTAAAASASPYSALSDEWAADWSAKKLDAVMALYAPDAEFMPGFTESWVGTATIRKNFAGMLAQYTTDLHLHSMRCAASGDLAYDSGVYDETITQLKDGKVIRPRGNYLFVFQRQKNGEWKILEQTWTLFGPRKL
jgi:uncharacterized protein (TIGR02246 family)